MNSPAPARRTPVALIVGALLLLGLVAGALFWRMNSNKALAERPPLEGASIGGPFTLVDENGRTVTDQSFAGRWRLVYFGYTFCPDVCPTDMQALAKGFQAFETAEPARAAMVQPIFVTIDPARDTPAVVKTFTDAFHPRFIGLTGSPAQIDAVLKAYRVYASRGAGTADTYLMDHSAIAYLMDPQGKPISFLPQGATSAAVTSELTKWVR